MAEATHKVITKVWIAPGCIVCDACENDCPEVFDVQEDTCLIRPPAMNADFLRPLTPSIIVASIAFALTMGFAGGFLPAARAARMKIVDALRAA